MALSLSRVRRQIWQEDDSRRTHVRNGTIRLRESSTFDPLRNLSARLTVWIVWFRFRRTRSSPCPMDRSSLMGMRRWLDESFLLIQVKLELCFSLLCIGAEKRKNRWNRRRNFDETEDISSSFPKFCSFSKEAPSLPNYTSGDESKAFCSPSAPCLSS